MSTPGPDKEPDKESEKESGKEPGKETATIKLESSWLERLGDQFEMPYMQELRAFLLHERERGKVIYPKGGAYFNALDTTPFDQVKAVILGQDPYHGPGQAHGLCFSVQPGVAWPPSLQNIFKEVESELNDGGRYFQSGCLTPWAEQGVLLLNSVLTVERGHAASHQGKGWEQFTDRIIEVLSDECESLVFMLWGSYAQKKGSVIDRGRHLVLESPHPSPLSAHRGFFGNGHFRQCNEYLVSRGIAPVEWLFAT